MLNQNDTQYVEYLDRLGTLADHGTGNLTPAIIARWASLKNRLADEIRDGYTLLRIANETGLDQSSINEWAADYKKYRHVDIGVRRSLNGSLADKIELALEKLFEGIDKKRELQPFEPKFIETSVSKNIIHAAVNIRAVTEVGEIKTFPGSGKTFTMNHFIAECRKKEGFDCPVWAITLTESNNSLKHILYEIAYAISALPNQWQLGSRLPELKDEYAMAKYIERLTTDRPGGLLFIDEAQNICEHLRGATQKHSLITLNELRRFTDLKLFGIVLLSNGEIFQNVKRNGSAQLSRRMDAWRTDAGRPTPNDIDLIMKEWRVSGKYERDWSVKVGTGEGGIGMLTNFYRSSRSRYGVINAATLKNFRKV